MKISPSFALWVFALGVGCNTSDDGVPRTIAPRADMQMMQPEMDVVTPEPDMPSSMADQGSDSGQTADDGGVDTTAPQVTGYSPEPGEDNVAVDAPIVLSLSEAIAPESLSDEAVVVANADGAQVAKQLSLNDDGTALTIALLTPPRAPETLTIAVTDKLLDVAGNALEVPAMSWSFSYPSWRTVLEQAGRQNKSLSVRLACCAPDGRRWTTERDSVTRQDQVRVVTPTGLIDLGPPVDYGESEIFNARILSTSSGDLYAISLRQSARDQTEYEAVIHKLEQNSWTAVETPDDFKRLDTSISLSLLGAALAEDATLYVVARNQLYSYDGAAWETIGTPEIMSGEQFVRFSDTPVVTLDNVPYLGFFTRVIQIGNVPAIRVARPEPGRWGYLGTRASLLGTTPSSRLFARPDGVLSLFFETSSEGTSLFSWSPSMSGGGSWEREAHSEDVSDLSRDTLAYAPDSTPYRIAAPDQTTNAVLVERFDDNTGWTMVGGPTGITATMPSTQTGLVVPDDNVPLIIYSGTSGDEYVIKRLNR